MVSVTRNNSAGTHVQIAQPPEPNGAFTETVTDVRAFLEHLTGPTRSRITWLAPDTVLIGVGADRGLCVAMQTDAVTCPPFVRLTWSGETYSIEALGDADVWLNGRKTGAAQLLHGDMLEFGELGPMTRFRLCGQGYPMRWPVEEIVSDAVAYARTSRRPMPARLSNALWDSARRLLLETTLVFRIGVILVLCLLTFFLAWQYRSDLRMQGTLAQDALRLEAISAALTQTQDKALTSGDLADLREQMDLHLKTNAERLSVLEQRLGASAPSVIGAATTSVAFIQGAYGLRHAASGKMLRHVLGPDGTPLQTPFGKPVVDPEGTGAPLEVQFTGTGFLLRATGHLVTNRHVALPWTGSNRQEAFQQSGLVPEMIRCIAYFPGLSIAADTELLGYSESADLALLGVAADVAQGRGLILAQEAPNIGDEVILIGFATGLRAMLAQAGRDFLVALEAAGETDFWTIAARLSEQDQIAPLASRGIIAQIADRAVIYDAETTAGGSGGPALNKDGHVVAVNAAILPEFGGANIGVPAHEVRRLLEAVAAQQ